MAARIMLNKTRKKRLEAGHPWIYRNEVERVEGETAPGGVAEVYDHRGKFLASAYMNPASTMIGRVVSYQPIERMDRAFFVERFRICQEVRERFTEDARYCRLVYGEADFLPGLTVDRFGDVFVLQIVTLGMDAVRETIVEALVEVFAPRTIYERSDVGVRSLEGLEERTGLLYGEEPPETVIIRENGLELEVDVVGGQKTGYFFDQRENRASIRPLMTGWGRRSGIELSETVGEDGVMRRTPVNANGKEVSFPYWDGATVLECFSHTGSFTLHACKYGAKKVTCLDISEHAIETARRNAARNGFEDRVEFVVANAFDYLREQVRGLEERAARAMAGESGGKIDTSKPLTGGRSWDVVILDPPAFAKNKAAVPGALRGYKDINLHGMKLVNEGGFLVTASCSYHVRPDAFLEAIHAAAADAGKLLRLVEYRGAGKDHPRLLGVEEGNYLKFAIFEVRSR